MEMTQFFNILLLTLSLATILLTLISYVLYRVRSLPGIGKSPEQIKMQGAFFSRYLPQGMKVVPQKNALPTRAEPGKFKLFLKAKLPENVLGFFAVTVGVIFCCLIFQAYLKKRNPDTAPKVATDYSSIYKKGILKNYQWEPLRGGELLNESIPSAELKNLEAKVDWLKKVKIYLLETSDNHQSNPGATSAALAAWGRFFSKNGLQASATPTVPKLAANELLILPDAKVLTSAERDQIDAAIKSGASILATGPVGVVNEKGAPYTDDWSSRNFGVKFVAIDAKANLPTLFSSRAQVGGPVWEVPPGLLVNVYPADAGFRAVSVQGVTAARESNFHAQVDTTTNSSRAQFLNHGNGRAAWLAFDPPETLQGKTMPAGSPGFEDHHLREAIVSSLAWASRVPLIRISPWKGDLPASIVVSIDSEDKFENVGRYLELFNTLHYPATFFNVSHLLKQAPATYANAPSSIEVASHSEDHSDFEGQTSQTQFDRIQASRFEIEEVTETPVLGFRPPEEKFDETTVEAALQNHLRYFSGNNRFHRFAPVWIADAKLLYFPRVSMDDFEISHRADLSTEAAVKAALIDDFTRISETGGTYLLSLHTQIFGQENFFRGLTSALKEIGEQSVWKTNYAEVTARFRARADIELTIAPSPDKKGQFLLTAVNTGTTPTPELNVQFDLAQAENAAVQVQEVGSEKGTPVSERKLSSVAPGSTSMKTSFSMASIPAGHSRLFNLITVDHP
jgi:peptidoglycan/xylan/chitin deacetylase (PgdA/CDA1 family)